jgi:precorrin-3B methylase
MEEKTKIDDSKMLLGYQLYMKFIERSEDLTEKEKEKLRLMGIKI